MDIRKFVSIGLKITALFYDDAKDHYRRIFNQVDEVGKDTLDFNQFM